MRYAYPPYLVLRWISAAHPPKPTAHSHVGWISVAHPPKPIALLAMQAGDLYRLFGAPRCLIPALGYSAAKRRPWPIAGAGSQAVFHRVVMDVIHVIAPILLIAEGMFPEPPLPYRTLIAVIGAGIDLSRGSLLYFTPARGIIGVALRHAPDTMQVIGQDNQCVNPERPCRLHLAERFPQRPDARLVDEYRSTVESDHSKEINATRNMRPAIVAHHGLLLSCGGCAALIHPTYCGGCAALIHPTSTPS